MTVDSELTVRDAETAAIIAEAKTEDGYQCRWCRRNLQQPSGLLRHRAYCSWNPSLRDWEKEELTPTVKQEPTSPTPLHPDRHQCEWCNRFFQNQKGVVRHKTYCAWNPMRLRALKEDRARMREQKAALKNQRNAWKNCRRTLSSFNSSSPSSPTSSLPTSPLSSADSTPVSPRSPFNFSSLPSGQITPRSKEESNPFTFNQAAIAPRHRPGHPYKPNQPEPVHVSVITSTFDLDCNCGCTKMHAHADQKFLQARAFVTNQLRKSSIESPSSSPKTIDEDFDEEIDVES